MQCRNVYLKCALNGKIIMLPDWKIESKLFVFLASCLQIYRIDTYIFSHAMINFCLTLSIESSTSIINLKRGSDFLFPYRIEKLQLLRTSRSHSDLHFCLSAESIGSRISWKRFASTNTHSDLWRLWWRGGSHSSWCPRRQWRISTSRSWCACKSRPRSASCFCRIGLPRNKRKLRSSSTCHLNRIFFSFFILRTLVLTMQMSRAWYRTNMERMTCAWFFFYM